MNRSLFFNRIARRPGNRRGATVLEMSIIVLAYLTLVLGTIDLGIGVFRYHILAQAARQAARRAAVHGSMANVLGAWGPSTIDVPATANGVPIVDGADDGIKNMLVGCELSQTRIRLEWIDGSNQLEDRVRARVSSPYQPLMFFIFGGNSRTLSATSTMPIAH